MPVLSETQIRAAKPRDKDYKLFDTLGLYLKESTSGARLWRFKYHYGPVERLWSVVDTADGVENS